MSTYKNVSVEQQGSKLIITIDSSVNMGPSKTGKSLIIGSTEGNKEVMPGIFLGVNCYKTR